jgi:hypothetical protein
VRAKSTSIALLEREGGSSGEPPAMFDAFVLTEAAARPDPCEELRKRFKRAS